MKDKSIFEGVVLFEEGGHTYQAIRKDGYWVMAMMEQARILEIHDVVVPDDATPGGFLKVWWKAQKAAGTYTPH